MELVKIQKSALLKTLKKNRKVHRGIFLEAQDGYREKVIDVLDKALKDAREGRSIKIYFQLTAPVDQTSDYDRAIKMIEMSVDENIEISEHDFSCYILDDWSWKQNFLTSNTMYLKTK